MYYRDLMLSDSGGMGVGDARAHSFAVSIMREEIPICPRVTHTAT